MKTYGFDDALPARQRIDSWMSVLSDLFVELDYVSIDSESDRSLSGRIERRALSKIDVTVVRSSRQLLKRERKARVDKTGDYLFCVLQKQGRGAVRQDHRVAELEPGDLVCYDTTRPYEIEFSNNFEQIVVSVPRDLIRVHVASTENVTATNLSGKRTLTKMLGDLFVSLPSAIDENDTFTHEALATGVLEMIAANLRSLVPTEVSSVSKLKRYHLDRIKAYITTRLGDPDLCVSAVSEALGMSISSLYRAFEGEPCTLSQLVWTQRLEGARVALLDRSRGNKSIKEVAFEWGFADPAYFSRAFRRRFGTSPSTLRP
jgi:AraC-like DNA-binding protein